jgi:hypothetical protein
MRSYGRARADAVQVGTWGMSLMPSRPAGAANTRNSSTPETVITGQRPVQLRS